MVDIILIVICAYIFYQLYTVLGQRPSVSSPQDSAFKSAPNTQKDSKKAHPQETIFVTQHPKAEAILKQIDVSLTSEVFLHACAQSFKLITKAYCEGDRETLDQLVEPKLYKSFGQALRQREKVGHREVLDELIILKVSYEKAWVLNAVAHISIRIESIQKRDLLNNQGHYVDLEEIDTSIPVVDVWTFCRFLETEDPTWRLKQVTALDA